MSATACQPIISLKNQLTYLAQKVKLIKSLNYDMFQKFNFFVSFDGYSL